MTENKKNNIQIELIQKLRNTSGAGVLDCKNALVESKGDLDKALQILREKGIAKALKKSTREVKDGLISAYIHQGNRIGVLLEVNCETDFVARTDEFKNLVKELGLQIAAANPQWVNSEDIPQATIDKEKEIYRKQIQQMDKPKNIIDKIVQGKLQKFYVEVCLLEQPYIRDPQGKQKVKDLINSAVSKIGENITVRRFVRFQLGEE
jgi:elongation factor Ts